KLTTQSTACLISSIKPYRKNEKMEKFEKMNDKSKPKKTELKVNTLSNATLNTLAMKSISKDKKIEKKQVSNNSPNKKVHNTNINITTTQKKQTFISHKGANSMPKLTTNNIYNNFNIINNYPSVLSPTQINIYNNIDI